MNSGWKAVFQVAPKFVNRSPFIYSTARRLRLNTAPTHFFIHLKHKLSVILYTVDYFPSPQAFFTSLPEIVRCA